MPLFDALFVKTLKRVLGLLICLFLGAQAVAQPRPVQGIVWRAPASEALAAQDLMRLHRLGVQAIRTRPIRNERLLTLADTLGLQFYQDLPLEYLPAAALNDSLRAAAALLDDLLRRAAAHPSARHFGLARYADTSDPAACAYFEQLAQRVRTRGPAGSQVYYLSVFAEADQCAGAVDFVLLDARDQDDPKALLARWQARHPETPVGLGALGRWVRADTLRGLRVSNSPEQQARYLEQHLEALLYDTTTAVPNAVFVYRWRDVDLSAPSLAYGFEAPHRRPHGLFAADGTPRPALQVVQGFYTGRQRAFAFDAGPVERRSAYWFLLLGWGVAALIGLYYALSPRFRHMVPRYFQAHHFYQDAVREGRDVLFGASLVLLIALGTAAGMTLYLALEVGRHHEAFNVFFGWQPGWVQQLGLTLLGQPGGLIALVAGFYALAQVLWAGLLSALSRRRYMLAPGQSLMLVTWPRWPLLLVLAAAMAVSTLPADRAAQAVLVLLGAWLVISLYAHLRTIYDYTSVTRVPLYVPVILLFVNPFVLTLVVLAAVMLGARTETTFLWHLVTRT